MIDAGDGGSAKLDTDALLRKALLLNLQQQEQIAKLTSEVAELTRRNAELLEKLEKNSRNSNKPPSSDGLGDRRRIRKGKKPTGRKRGGQQGHKGHSRALLPAAAVDHVVDVFPTHCDHCLGTPPRTVTSNPTRHQVVELLEGGGRYVTEYRLHSLPCECGEMLSPCYDEVPRSAFGPRLKSVVSMLTGNFQLSRRQVVVFLDEVFGIRMSLGSVSNIEGQMSTALQTPSDEALEAAEVAAVKHMDETSWLRDFEPCSAWVIATAAVSVFRIVANGRRASLLEVLQREHRGVLVSDRASVFLFWSMDKRQICWSHLQRKFVGFSQRDGPAGALGKDLVTCAELVFGYWRQYCSGELSREQFEKWMGALTDTTKQTLERAANAGIAGMSGSCANMLKHWDAMWTFVTTPGVEPTNNHAERELRRLVIWRRGCFGSRSKRGLRFVERMLTVTHTLRKQGNRVLQFLTHAYQAMTYGQHAPKLLASA